MDGKKKESREHFLKFCICHPGKTLTADTLEFRILSFLFKYLTSIVSVETDAGYYICADSDDLEVSINVEIMDKKESTDIQKLVQKRIDSMTKALQNFNFKNASKTVRWCIRSVKILGINTDKFLYIEHGSKKHFIILDVFKTIPWKTEVFETTFKESGLTVRQVVDPLIYDYGLYVNHSKKFEDFCICWNILHLYEHLMVPWDILGDEKNLLTNGFTTPTGLCYCYTVLDSKQALRRDYNKFISFFNKVRKDPSFLKSKIKLEERRTFSESIEDKDFSSFGRADPDLYDKGYNIEIFKYYANQPLDILLICPEKIDVDSLDKLSKIVKVETPKKKEFDEPGLAMFRNRMTRSIIIEDMKHKTPSSYNGVNCVLNSIIGEPLNEMNNLISNTFRTFSKTDLEEYLSKRIIPNDNIGISRIDDELVKSAFYTFDAQKTVKN